MENMQRIRIMNILHDMESAIYNDAHISKDQALDLMRSVDRLWDELKGESHFEEILQRATRSWDQLPTLQDYSRKIREQLFQA